MKEYFNKNSENKLNLSTPSIFNKKIKKTSVRKIEYISSDTGKDRHFPPAAQEWYNSIYSYNAHYIKGLVSSDKTLMRFLNGYFSMYIDNRAFTKIKSKALDLFRRRRSSKKIFIGKGELKHTNSKVIITFYVHNTEKLSLKSEYLRLHKSIHSQKKKNLIKYIALDNNETKVENNMDNENIKFNRPYTLDEFFSSPKNYRTKIVKKIKSEIPPVIQLTYYEVYYSIVSSFINNLTTYIEALTKYYDYLTNLVELKVLNNHEKYLIFMDKANNFFAYDYPKYNTYKNIAKKNYLENLYRLRHGVKFNSVKFENPFIAKLTNIVEKLYFKKVEFNIVNLKKMHLSSDILTQGIVLKLKNRKNRFIRVLRSSLNKVNLPNVSRLGEKFSRTNLNDFLINKIRNTYINSMFNDITKIDPLNKLLLNFFPSADKLEVETKLTKNKAKASLKYFVFKELKQFKLAGIRLEAKGRLSRRYTAARSVFKLTWKGGLKNVDSSFKGLSTVMLRGDARSNVDYSMLKSKQRIGAYGIKGWVASK